MQAEQSILDRIQRRQLKWDGHLFRREDSRWPKQSWKNQVTDFMRSRNMVEDMADDRNLWCLGVDGRFLAV